MADQLDRRTKVYKDILEAMPKSDPAIDETIDGQEYRYLPEPRCRVCTAGDPKKNLPNGAQVGNLVDNLLLYPKSIADVYKTVEPMMVDWPSKTRITYKSIRTHLNKHLAWDRLAMRLMVERWAQEKGLSVMDASGRMILTEEAWLEATAHIGWQRLLSGALEPSWAETQKAFERYSEIRRQAEGEFSTAELLAQMNIIIDVVREFIPIERREEFVARLEEREVSSLPVPVQTTDDEFAMIIEEQSKFTSEEG